MQDYERANRLNIIANQARLVSRQRQAGQGQQAEGAGQQAGAGAAGKGSAAGKGRAAARGRATPGHPSPLNPLRHGTPVQQPSCTLTPQFTASPLQADRSKKARLLSNPRAPLHPQLSTPSPRPSSLTLRHLAGRPFEEGTAGELQGRRC